MHSKLLGMEYSLLRFSSVLSVQPHLLPLPLSELNAHPYQTVYLKFLEYFMLCCTHVVPSVWSALPTLVNLRLLHHLQVVVHIHPPPLSGTHYFFLYIFNICNQYIYHNVLSLVYMHLNYKLLESKAVSFTSLAISIESGNAIRNWCSVNVYWSGPCLLLQFYVWLIFSHFLPSQYTLYLDKDSAYLLCIARVPRTPLYHGTCITLLSLSVFMSIFPTRV